jgi:hypothetical protein
MCPDMKNSRALADLVLRLLFPAGQRVRQMDIDNALAGHLVASVFEVLLVDAGYEVVPTGVERTVRELRTVTRDAYRELAHPRLRSIPDFFVLDVEARQSWLTEVKSRQSICRALCDDLRPIQQEWAPFTLVLAVAESPKEWTGIVDHIRAFTIEADTRLDQQFFNDLGARLQDVFPRLGKRWEEGTIQKAQDAILRILSR